MKRQNELLAEIELNDNKFALELHKTEKQLENLESTAGIIVNPGMAINHLMLKWGEDPLETKQNFHIYATELWKTR